MAPGTISGFGTGAISGSTTETFKNLQTYRVQAGANWTLSGTNTIKDGDSLTILGTLSAAGAFTVAGSLQGAGKLSVTSGTTTLQAGSGFTVANLAQSGASTIVLNGGRSPTLARCAGSASTLSVGTGHVLTLTGADAFSGTLAGAGTVALSGGSATFNATAVLTGRCKVTQSGTSVVSITAGCAELRRGLDPDVRGTLSTSASGPNPELQRRRQHARRRLGRRRDGGDHRRARTR